MRATIAEHLEIAEAVLARDPDAEFMRARAAERDDRARAVGAALRMAELSEA